MNGIIIYVENPQRWHRHNNFPFQLLPSY